ncbi:MULTISPECIES: hypothetical protein [Leucobacter]|uniref:Uncharacterized protein n=2 Tax=Leucobacter TaxID=55968 RepID=A0A1H0YJ54_9MICO|nr:MULTISPECIES: hypothetical protein [Leucobacter]MBS3182363.1 hypothetical protein [Leucobacter manosquensis]SDQ15222.1 hypothetical protein SAMN04488565_0926 [Leucobacter chromiiresistens]
MNTDNGVDSLVDESLTLFAECDPGITDPYLEEAWALLVDLVQMAGARLMEHRFGGLISAADEVALYLGQLERVSQVAREAPFQVPAIALRPLKAAGRFVEHSPHRDEVCQLLLAMPHIIAGYASYLTRTAGRPARPALDVLDLAVRAGSVYRDSLTRAVPAL